MCGLIMATPRVKYMNQIINRIFRLGGDQKRRRYIVDIVDYKTRIKNQYYKRKDAYIERECDINYSDVHYTEIEVMGKNETAL
jgi:hypothetical protein